MGQIRNFFIICIFAFVTVSCSSTPRVVTEVQEVKTPILYCPAPPNFNKPRLPITELTPEQKKDYDAVAKAAKATIKAQEGYINVLEKIIEQYQKNSDSYENLLQQLRKDFGEGIEYIIKEEKNED